LALVGAVSILIRSRDPSVTSLESLFDRTYLGLGLPVFLDDLEAGSTCRWSSVQSGLVTR